MKKTFTYTTVIILATIILLSFRLSDGDFLKGLRTKLTEYNKLYPEERVYLHLDKTLYKPGEDIWYKAYLVDGSSLEPVTTSSVVYVELVDPRGTVVKKSELYVQEGTTHGDFALGKDAAGGLYTIKAYTRWMQNFQEEAFFTKQLTVQGVITPRLLLKIDFEKKAYGSSDVVKAHLKVRNLKDQPLSDAEVKAQLKLKGNEYKSQTFHTDAAGEADIVFQLPDTLNTTDGLLQAVVSMSGVEESISRLVPIVLNKIQLRFFPEGGELIAGSGGRVALEAVNEFGKGADVEGVVTDETGRTVSSFESYHLGMGAFSLPAEKGHQYTARITRPQGIDQDYPLPTVKSEGLALSITEQTDSTIMARIFSSSATQAYLAGHVHGKIYQTHVLPISAGWNDVVISIRSMPAGIAVFTLFDAERIEKCERLVFVNRHKTLQVELTTDRKEYLPGDKVELKVKTSDQTGKPVSANLSVAVVDDQVIAAMDDKQDNLLSWMLLGSELKGKIEEPSFYFDADEPKAKRAMDYLLLVHGWRRFTWKEVFTPTQALAYLPENESCLSGQIFNSKNTNSQAEVVLMEVSNRKRIVKMKSDTNGQFLFRNVDASSPIVLLTRKPNTIEVSGRNSTSIQPSDRYYDFDNRSERYYRINPVMELNDQAANDAPLSRVDDAGEMNVNMNADTQQLSEVVVTALGVSEEAKALGASVTRIVNEMPAALFTSQSLEPQLNGRVAGLVISQNSAAGAGANVQIRGMNSLGSQSEPLWVIDGIPLAGSVNANFTTGSQLTPANINSISVLKGPEAAVLFGSRAVNGVILVQTKARSGHSNFKYVMKRPKYSVVAISPRTFTATREFYVDPVKEKESRDNFKTTVYWKHTVVTDNNGEAKIQFHNNDAVSAFRISAEGISGNGLIGRKETTYHTLLPFSLDTRLPEYLGFEDTLRLPIRITNNTNTKLSGKLSVLIPGQLRSTDPLRRTVEVDANTTTTIPVSILPSGVAGSFPVTITLEGDRYKDKVNRLIEVHPVGFPVTTSYSGKSLNKTLTFPMNDVEKGSVKGEVVFVTNVLDELFTGVDAMLREPHGCFEQVSSSTFPNILALQFLRKTGKSNHEVERKALNYISSGYKMLKGYEINSGGFEWFGNPPAHEALTAYGLIEFKEMQKVFSGVDPQMIERTKTWLLKRRRGDGTFRQGKQGMDGFASAAAEVNNAYIVYALSEAGVTDIDAEYRHSLSQAMRTEDMYLSALVANAAINAGKMSDYNTLKVMFNKAVAANGFEALKINSSITHSYGNSLANETVALWALALMKDPSPNYKHIAECLEFIGTKKSFGMYGSTQATYLSLKAITEYHTLMERAHTDGDIQVTVNQENSMTRTFTKETGENIVFNGFSQQLKEGSNKIIIGFANTTEPLPYSVNLTWNTRTPASSSDCKLKIETKLRQTEVKLNETVRLAIKLSNTTAAGVPMSMAVVGIPAGLSLQPWQLKALKENGAFDFYEIIGDKFVIYYRELGPAQTKEINLDLKADLPGYFLSAASCAYLYYASEFKHWVGGSKVSVAR